MPVPSPLPAFDPQQYTRPLMRVTPQVYMNPLLILVKASPPETDMGVSSMVVDPVPS